MCLDGQRHQHEVTQSQNKSEVKKGATYKKIMLGKHANVMQKQQKLNPNNQYIYLMYHRQ